MVCSDLTIASVCSGVGGELIAAPDGWRGLWFSEVSPFPSAVLDYRFPSIPNHGDLNEFENWKIKERPDVLIAGTPCQSFSTAGAKRGFDDPRGQLTIKYFELVARLRPRWVIWENVPNALNTALPLVIDHLTDSGYCAAWRILNSIGFGVPQKRRRLFLVAHHQDWRCAGAVLFDGAGGRRIPQARQEQHAAGVSGIVGTVYSQYRSDGENHFTKGDATGALVASMHKSDARPMVWCPGASSDGAVTKQDHIGCLDGQGKVGGAARVVVEQGGLRFLTPEECEQLMGIPPGWTAIPWNGKPADQCPTGHRYLAIGNAICIDPLRWILERLGFVDKLTRGKSNERI